MPVFAGLYLLICCCWYCPMPYFILACSAEWKVPHCSIRLFMHHPGWPLLWVICLCVPVIVIVCACTFTKTLGNRKALLITAHVMLALLVWFTVLMINSLVIDSAIAFDIRESYFFLIAIHLLRLFVLPPPVWPLHYLRQAAAGALRNRQWWWIFPVTVLFILLLQGLINGMPDRHFGGFSLVLWF